MSEAQKRKPLFWPALFGGAFLLGGVLWCVWMWHLVLKTREERDDGFFVPVAGQTAPAQPAAPPNNSNATNSK